MPKTLKTESGSFTIDDNGALTAFTPSEENLRRHETTVTGRYGRKYTARDELGTLIFPEGVRSIDGFRGIYVSGSFTLPETLERIGENSFANCILQMVRIPSGVKELGSFSFGGSYIDILQLPDGIESPYRRQFKDSYIGTLMVPQSMGHLVRDGIFLGEMNYAFCLSETEAVVY